VKSLKQQVEQTLSKQYNGRPVHIVGEKLWVDIFIQ
jgi:hypothetical protein